MANIITLILIVNMIISFYIVFRHQRSVATSWAWLIILLIFPVAGFIIYGFIGRGISKENLFAINKQKHISLDKVNKMQAYSLEKIFSNDTSHKAIQLIKYFNNQKEAPLSKNNAIEIYTDNQSNFQKIFNDMQNAHHTINVEYYSFMNDQLGNKFLTLLIDKAKNGIKVRIIFDPWGSLGTKLSWFKPLIKVGGEVIPFITSQNNIKKYRINYHMHRKIVVIDGKIAWTGGYNIGDQYIGHNKKFGYWRDTNIRLVGPAALLLQERFVMDWNASNDYKHTIKFSDLLFPKCNNDPYNTNHSTVQVVNDGPDKEVPYLRNGMIKLMMMAKESIWIQTPYLIPDDPMIATWVTAATSGVDVRIMIPCMPDHIGIYRATEWYANYLMNMGIKIYIYEKGFLHAKTVTIDNDFSTVGSMNQDYRSYLLNFEDEIIIYDNTITKQLKDIFKHDMCECYQLTPTITERWSKWLKFKQAFARMFSPFL